MPRYIFLAALLLVAACGLPAPPGGVPPTPVASWSPPGSPRAVVLALHGFNDHKAAFAEFGAHAATQGVLVEAYDQPGFGERADRGRWAGTEALVRELHAAIGSARERHPDVPVFVLGESMGAAVAIVALARPDAPPVDGVILAAPAVLASDSLPRGYLTALRVLAALVPPFRVNGNNLGLLASDNIEMLRALGRDPLYVRETRIDAVAGLVEVMEEARKAAPRLELPTLVLLGARDEIVPPQASRAFVHGLDPRRCSVVTYLHGWHLLLRDHQRERVFRDVVAWVGGERPPSRLDHPCGPPPAS